MDEMDSVSETHNHERIWITARSEGHSILI
jgi:hypothetical protein